LDTGERIFQAAHMLAQTYPHDTGHQKSGRLQERLVAGRLVRGNPADIADVDTDAAQ